ncbi:MAG: hypothetical protein AB8B59_18370 [Maribacter sp.]
MKKITLLILCSAFLFTTLSAQNSCSKYYPMTEGSTFEYTNYNKKGKVDGVINYKVSAVTSEGSATKATLDFKMTDKKGKEIFATDYNYTCENNMVKIDYNSLFPAQMMKQYSDMDVEMNISGTDIEIPNDLSVGKKLSDANVSMDLNMGGIKMNISVDQTNRRVEKKENITTPTGTFDCYVLTEQTNSKTMGTTISLTSKIWLAEGVGMVKQETYKKNGDLMSRMELTNYSK